MLDSTGFSIYNGNQMVTNKDHNTGLTAQAEAALSRQLDLTFSALSDATRRAILERLSSGEASVGTLAEPFNMSRPAISKHLRVLEKAGLVRRTRDGRVSRCELDAAPMKVASDWVAAYRQYWENQLDLLQDYFERKH